MDSSKTIHAGHRERMLLKFKNNPNSMLDHELLEVLLYPILPRIDTNPLAHTLINTFGSFSAVFNATFSQLVGVKGVGEKTAIYINLLAKSIDTVINSNDCPVILNGFEAIKREASKIFNFEKEEKLFLYMLDKKYKKIATLQFSDRDFYAVKLEVSEIANAFALYKPAHVILLHNHPSGVAEPSKADDISTKRINLLCESHGIDFCDHVIAGTGDFFSYVRSGRMDEIKKSADLKKILDSFD